MFSTVYGSKLNKETQKGLNEIVTNKVRSMIDGKAAGVEATMTRLVNEGKIAQDFIAPIGVDLKRNSHQPVVTFAGEDSTLFLDMPDGRFDLHANAVSQLAERMSIPQRYLRELSTSGETWKVALAAQILNEHSGWTERNKVLIRAVGQQVRGVLSDSYRRLNSVDIMIAFIQEASNQGAVIADAYMNDTKIWAETILPTPITIPTKNNGEVIIFAGARLSTSDYGDGAVNMRSFLLNGACLNGMVRENIMKQVHLGGKLGENLALSQHTYELDTKTTASAVTDFTKNLFSKDTIEAKAIEIQGASEIEIDPAKEIKKLTSSGNLLKAEGEAIAQLLMKNDPEDGVQGGATLWKLTQAITAHARELTPERSRDLQEISGNLMERVAVG